MSPNLISMALPYGILTMMLLGMALMCYALIVSNKPKNNQP